MRNLLALTTGILLPLSFATAMAASPFDGTYVGTQREARNNNSGLCINLNRDDARIRVSDSKFTYKWGQPFEVIVDAAGAVNGAGESLQSTRTSSNVAIFKGQITGGALEADVGTRACGVHLSLKKS